MIIGGITFGIAAFIWKRAAWSPCGHAETPAAKREVLSYRGLHRDEEIADVDVIIEWSNRSGPGGKASFVLRKVQPGEKRQGDSVLGNGDVMWDGNDGYGGYSAFLDTSRERWVFLVEAYWTIAGVSGQFEKRFPIVPFETTVFQDGDFRAEISYDTGLLRKAPNKVRESTSGLGSQ